MFSSAWLYVCTMVWSVSAFMLLMDDLCVLGSWAFFLAYCRVVFSTFGW